MIGRYLLRPVIIGKKSVTTTFNCYRRFLCVVATSSSSSSSIFSSSISLSSLVSYPLRHHHNILAIENYYVKRPKTPIRRITSTDVTVSRAITTTTTATNTTSDIRNTKVSVLSPSTKSSSSIREYYDNLRHKTMEWLQIPINSWTRQDVSMGRFLMREWSDITSTSSSSSTSTSTLSATTIEEERAIQQTKIVRRFIREHIAKANNNDSSTTASIKYDTQQQQNHHPRIFHQSRIRRGGISNKNNNNNNNNADTMNNSANNNNNKKDSTFNSREMVEMLNRCLDSLRKVPLPISSSLTTTTNSSSSSSSSSNNNRIRNDNNNNNSGRIRRSTTTGTINPPLESMRLMDLFRDTSILLNDKDLRPNQKTYSMCMNVLSLYPKSFTACDDVLSLYEHCLKESSTLDLQFYNVCLHTLAKFGTYHPEQAPVLVERIFQEMTTSTSTTTTNNNLSPNTGCFVSLLHVWANTITSTTNNNNNNHNNNNNNNNSNATTTTAATKIETSNRLPLAADRAEAILEQMIHNYPNLVDVICFNICIDAWAKQGFPERAEKLLWRLIQSSNGNKSGTNNNTNDDKQILRPNEISFNSAINAWAKSCGTGRRASTTNRQRSDPQKAAERAGILLEQMKLHGCEPTSETFATVMEAYSNTTPEPGVKVQFFLDDLETMNLEGALSIPPPKVCYLMAIRAWGRTKSLSIPKEKASSSSSSSSYNQVELSGAERAELLLRRMEEFSSHDGGHSGLEPCVIIYTAVINAWSQSNDETAPDRAWALFCQMRRGGVSGKNNVFPNVISLNALLSTFCNHGRVEEAHEVLEKSKRHVRPDSKSYLIILRGYAKSNDSNAAENAHDLLKELENIYSHGDSTRKIKPTVNMYSQLLVAWGNNSRNDAAFRAEEIFWQMIRQEDVSVLPDTATFNCVLRAWSKSFEGGAAERAEALLRRVQQEHGKEIVIDPISHLHLIYAWAHGRRKNAPLSAQRHLEEAKKLCCSGNSNNSHWRLTRAHFNGVILAWSKSNNKDASTHIRRLEIEMDSSLL
jgi:pentatricopeptide repeat protein